MPEESGRLNSRRPVFSRVLLGITRFRTELRVAEIIHRGIRRSRDRAETKVNGLSRKQWMITMAMHYVSVRRSARPARFPLAHIHIVNTERVICTRESFVGVCATKATNALGLAEIFRLFRPR